LSVPWEFEPPPIWQTLPFALKKIEIKTHTLRTEMRKKLHINNMWVHRTWKNKHAAETNCNNACSAIASLVVIQFLTSNC
jgi:hypothetical protein